MSADKGYSILKRLLGAYEVAKIKRGVKLNTEYLKKNLIFKDSQGMND